MRDIYEARLLELIPEWSKDLEVSDESTSVVKAQQNNIELRRWGIPFVPIDYQSEVINGLNGLIKDNNRVCGLLALPTGSGKTLTATRLVLDSLCVSKSRVLWLAPQRELLYQASEAFQSAWWAGAGPDSLDIRVVDNSSSFYLTDRPTCHMMTPIMARNLFKQCTTEYSIVVFDEAHHLAANVFKSIWKKICTEHTFLALGLSATPYRSNISDLIDLQDLFGKTLFLPKSLGYDPIKKLIDKKVLSKPIFRKISGVPSTSLSKGVNEPKRLKTLILDKARWERILNCILNDTVGQTVVYALDRTHGKYLTKALRANGENAEYVDGDSGLGERNDIFERFKHKQTRIIVNVNLLIEGVDCPAAQNVIFTFPVKSPIRLQQMIGRILRGPLIGGSEESFVYSIDGDQEWLNNYVFRDEYIFSGWNVLHLE